jgi:hypothetical protein
MTMPERKISWTAGGWLWLLSSRGNRKDSNDNNMVWWCCGAVAWLPFHLYIAIGRRGSSEAWQCCLVGLLSSLLKETTFQRA